MSLIKLTKRKVLLGVPGALLLLAAGFVAVEHFRGQRALSRELSQLRAKGETISVTELTPPMPAADADGGPPFLGAGSRLGAGGVDVNDVPGAWRSVAPGKVRLATQQRAWRRAVRSNDTNLLTAEELGGAIEAASADLETVRSALKKPSLYFGVRYSQNAMIPHLAMGKRAASWLRAASLDRLLASDVEGALANLEAAAALPRLQMEERFLISQLVGLAEANIGVSAAWEALQSPGWTEPQLARLQSAWTAGPNYLEPMARSFEMERAMAHDLYAKTTLSQLAVYMNGGGLGGGGGAGGMGPWTGWQNFLEELPKACGQAFQRHVYLPLWSIAWSGQDEARLLGESRLSLAAVRQAAASHSLLSIQDQLPGEVETPGTERKGLAQFYDRCRYLLSYSVGFQGGRTINRAALGETLRQMTITAIALHRYQLRHGRFPPDMAALVPEYLPAVPFDPMDGHPFRYRPKPDGTFLLYSVGEDGVDNGGDATPPKSWSTWSSSPISVQRGRDLVWPSPATAEEIAEADKQLEKKSRGRGR
jgi:hypothetical protein